MAASYTWQQYPDIFYCTDEVVRMCVIPAAGPSGRQSPLHNCSRLHCSAARWSPGKNKHVSGLYVVWWSECTVGVRHMTFVDCRLTFLFTVMLCHVMLDCAVRALWLQSDSSHMGVNHSSHQRFKPLLRRRLADQNRMQHAINVQSGYLQGCFHWCCTANW